MKIALGTSFDILDLPIIYGFQHLPALVDRVELVQKSSPESCQALLDREIEVAIISPADYARHSSELSIFPSVICASQSASKMALLFFKDNLTDLHNIAANNADSNYRNLAELVLKEFYEIDVNWTELGDTTSLESIFRHSNACFLEGQLAMKFAALTDRYIDIVEEWGDKTEQPFIHKIVVKHRESDLPDMESWLIRSLELGWRNVSNIAKKLAEPPIDWSFYFDLLNSNLYFRADEAIWDALRQYFQYLFFHGHLNEIPEIHLTESPRTD